MTSACSTSKSKICKDLADTATYFPDHPPPPPPPFSGRHMLPPSSPQHAQLQYGVQIPSARGLVPPPPISGARDVSTLSSTHRPASSMSISSMLGFDTGRPSREPVSATQSTGTPLITASSLSSPRPQSMAAPSPPQRIHGTGPVPRRSHSPEEHHNSYRLNTRPFRTYSGGLTQRQFLGAQVAPPEILRSGQVPNQNSAQYSQPVDHSQDNSLGRRSSVDVVAPSTVTTQQLGYRTPPAEIEDETDRYPTLFRPDERSLQNNQNRHIGSVKGTHDYGGNSSSLRRSDESGGQYGTTERDVQLSRQEGISQTSAYRSPKRRGINGVVTSNYPFLSRPSQQTALGLQQYSSDVEASGGGTPEQATDMLSNSSQPLNMAEALRRLRGPRSDESPLIREDLRQSPAQRDVRHQGKLQNQQVQRPPQEIPSAVLEDHYSPISRMGNNYRDVEESQQQPRASVGLVIDNSKRGGRFSPLPQAVQGAQGQLRGPASEPGIKNEFARMFSGIGSGVSSVTPTPGLVEPRAASSFPSSPTRAEEIGRRTPFSTRVDLSELSNPRITSRAVRRTKKVKEEELKLGGEGGEGCISPALINTRGTKRGRQSHHHHHQHLHNHQ